MAIDFKNKHIPQAVKQRIIEEYEKRYGKRHLLSVLVIWKSKDGSIKVSESIDGVDVRSRIDFGNLSKYENVEV